MKNRSRPILSKPCWFIPLLLIALISLLLPATGAEDEDKVLPANTEKQEPELVEFLTLEYKSEETPLTPNEETRRRWLGARIMDRVIQAGLADFILEGEVVDESGARLNGVELGVTKYKSLGPERGKEDREKRMIDGTFSVKARGYTYVYLYFSKEGYYQEKLELSCDDEDDPFSPDYKSDRKLDRRDIRMVLEKKGDITALIEEDFKLIYRRQEDGTASGRVADLDRKKWELPPDDRYLYSIAVTNLLDPEQIPSMCVYMIPKTDEEGRIMTETKVWGEGRWDKEVYPIELRLITSDPEGGFIIYEQEEGEWAYWSMKVAPGMGYKQELILDPDRFNERSFVQPDDGIYFYFKINDRYGKGRLRIPTFPEGDYALEMKTEFKLQADGTRNLDTGRW